MNAQIEERLRVIFGRRSVRVYSPGDVGEDAVQTLLAAAMAAPSASGKNPWHFVLVRNRPTRLRMSEALPYREMLQSAALVIVVCGDLELAHDHQLSYLLQDCSAAIENLLLCAHVLGLGACWLGVHPRMERIRAMKELFSLPQSVIPVACVSLGYPGEAKEPHAFYNPNCVHSETW